MTAVVSAVYRGRLLPDVLVRADRGVVGRVRVELVGLRVQVCGFRTALLGIESLLLGTELLPLCAGGALLRLRGLQVRLELRRLRTLTVLSGLRATLLD